MLGECKKLFRRDRTYLLCLTAGIALVLLYGMTGCYRMTRIWGLSDIDAYKEQVDILLNLWGSIEVENYYFSLMSVVFGIVAAAQLVKWHILEGRHGREFQKLLPIKSSSHLTYDFICGIIFIWIPFILGWLIVDGWLKVLDNYADCSSFLFERAVTLLIADSFFYVLLVFSKRITNSIPGTLLSAFVIGFGGYYISYCGEESSKFFFSGGSVAASPWAIVTIILIVLGVLMSYWCDKGKDISGNGTFSFKTAHYLIVGILFLELALVFCTFMSDMEAGALLGIIGGILLAGAVAFGVHYITKPKTM